MKGEFLAAMRPPGALFGSTVCVIANEYKLYPFAYQLTTYYAPFTRLAQAPSC